MWCQIHGAEGEGSRLSTKILTFCDLCNPLCLHQEDRRDDSRQSNGGGRRFTDGYSWIEGSPEEVAASGWIFTSHDKHICPKCYAKHKDAIFTV